MMTGAGGSAAAPEGDAGRIFMSRLLRAFCFVVLLGCAGSVISAQEAAKPAQAPAAAAPAAATTPAANPADVSSVDAIMAATYDVISGPAGKARDWDRFRSLFVPGARLMAVHEDKDGTFSLHAVSPDGYIERAGEYLVKNGFAERESARKAERYGNIVQVFSTYESRHDPSDAKPFARGINSFQLFFDGKRWWVVTIYWQEETPGNPIPKEFLPAH
jgi:hypothetical protein